MPSGEFNRLAPCHNCSVVRGRGKTIHRDRGARSSEVALLRCNRRGHPARTHLSQSRGAGEPAPTTSLRSPAR